MGFKRIARLGLDISNDIVRKVGLWPRIISRHRTREFKSPFKHTFIGYYDIEPDSYDGNFLLVLATDHDDVITRPVPATVGLIDLRTGIFDHLWSTESWCWQQGCRAQWYDETSVILNHVAECGRFESIVVDIKTKQKKKQFPLPIYDVNFSRQEALSLNFGGLHLHRPGYGYVDLAHKNLPDHSDGVFFIDLDSGDYSLIVSIARLKSFLPDSTMDGAVHYVNHIKYSPSGQYFIFYHFWKNKNERFSRCIIYGKDGALKLLPSDASSMSHYSFINDERILIYCDVNGPGYQIFDLKNDTVTRLSIEEHLDGHPTALPDGTVITDTYPGKFSREQALLLITKEKTDVLARFYSPRKYRGEFRCDLHPRLGRNRKTIFVDTPGRSGRVVVAIDAC